MSERKFFFTEHVINLWYSLLQEVLEVDNLTRFERDWENSQKVGLLVGMQRYSEECNKV